MFAPDLAVILRGNDAVVGERMIEGAPDIVVEVLSSDRNRDLVRKRQVYAEAGIPEYWIVDDQVNRDGCSSWNCAMESTWNAACLTADDTLTTPLLPGLEIPLSNVFRHRGRPRPEARVDFRWRRVPEIS